jgi:hypothetical protein
MRKERNLPQGRYRECSADYHSEHCPCVKCTRTDCGDCGATNQDHHTPRCLMRRANLHLPDRENLQWLSRECHALKDRCTPQLKFKQTFRTLDELREWRNRHDLVFK